MLYPGAVVMPGDVAKLARICATVCEENGVEPSSGTAQALAAHIFRLFMNGLTEEWSRHDAPQANAGLRRLEALSSPRVPFNAHTAICRRRSHRRQAPALMWRQARLLLDNAGIASAPAAAGDPRCRKNFPMINRVLN